MTLTLLAGALTLGCAEDPLNLGHGAARDNAEGPRQTYDVRLAHRGSFTPVRDLGTFPALAPGEQTVIRLHGGPGHRVGLATMMVETNDVFLGSDWGGMPLYHLDGTPRQGDVTRDIYVFDANTEVDSPMGTGPFQGARQDFPDQGPEEGVRDTVVRIDARGWEVGPNNQQYPVPEEMIAAELVYLQDGNFDLILTNVGHDVLPGGLPLSEGIWTVHHSDEWALLQFMQPATPGIELLAEAGDPSLLVEETRPLVGGLQPLGPLVYVLTDDDGRVFDEGQPASPGLEEYAEDGVAKRLLREGVERSDITAIGVIWETNRSETPDLLEPYQVYQFQIRARADERLHVLLHYANGNDWFVASDGGMKLMYGLDASRSLRLYDAGTEIDQRPGVHVTQAAYQPVHDLGEDENGVVEAVDGEIDGWSVPYADELVQFTVRLLGEDAPGIAVEPPKMD